MIRRSCVADRGACSPDCAGHSLAHTPTAPEATTALCTPYPSSSLSALGIIRSRYISCFASEREGNPPGRRHVCSSHRCSLQPRRLTTTGAPSQQHLWRVFGSDIHRADVISSPFCDVSRNLIVNLGLVRSMYGITLHQTSRYFRLFPKDALVLTVAVRLGFACF